MFFNTVSPAKRLNRSRCRFGCGRVGSKESRIIYPPRKGAVWRGDLAGNLLVAEVDGGQKCLVDLSAVHVVQQEPHRLYAAPRRTTVCRKLYTQWQHKFIHLNYNQHFLTSNHNSFRVLFDEILLYILFETYIYILAALESAYIVSAHFRSLYHWTMLAIGFWVKLPIDVKKTFFAFLKIWVTFFTFLTFF